MMKSQKKFLTLIPQVRFAGVANSKGEMIAGVQKDNVEKMLDENETKNVYSLCITKT